VLQRFQLENKAAGIQAEVRAAGFDERRAPHVGAQEPVRQRDPLPADHDLAHQKTDLPQRHRER